MVEAKVDGRRQRSAASRDRIVVAMIDLVAAGVISPSAEQIAARAGVGLRTVFRHFADMESLYAGMAMQLARQYEHWQDEFVAKDWRGQLAEALDRRLTTYEKLMPFKRAADVHRHASATIQAAHAHTLATMRVRLKGLLPNALANVPVAFELIDLLLSFETWQRLRLDQELAPDAARAVVERAVARVVD